MENRRGNRGHAKDAESVKAGLASSAASGYPVTGIFFCFSRTILVARYMLYKKGHQSNVKDRRRKTCSENTSHINEGKEDTLR
eukprot:1151767-Pelagomonas_calceolata.AAC.1